MENSVLPDWPYPRWIAHRGAGLLAPENTLAAFRLGAQHGYRMFECDAKLSADQVVVLLHDADLARTSNGQGLASKHTWARLSQLDAGSWHSPTYAGEPLGNLQSLAAFCQSNGHHLNIEIKPTPGLELHPGQVVGPTQKYGLATRIRVAGRGMYTYTALAATCCLAETGTLPRSRRIFEDAETGTVVDVAPWTSPSAELGTPQKQVRQAIFGPSSPYTQNRVRFWRHRPQKQVRKGASRSDPPHIAYPILRG